MSEGSMAAAAPEAIGTTRTSALSSLVSWTLLDPAGIGGVLLAIFIWYLASSAMGTRLPPPHEVVDNAIANLFSSDRLPGIGLPRGGYMPHLLFTACNVLLGGGVGATIPIVILAPFFLMWFGLSSVPQVALVAIYTATVLYLFALRGAKNLPPTFMDYAATLGCSAAQRFFSVRLPGVLPEIFGGLRIAFSAAWGLSAVTEMLGGRFGSGRVLVALRSVYDLTGIMAVVLLLGAFAIVLDCAIVAIRLYVLRWASFSQSTETPP
jgi:ABC-type nitrate/sulfonate/bicarbonate transport system permease component